MPSHSILIFIQNLCYSIWYPPFYQADIVVLLCALDNHVGMANPNALVVATAAMQAVNMIGMPEARIILSEAATYVATFWTNS